MMDKCNNNKKLYHIFGSREHISSVVSKWNKIYNEGCVPTTEFPVGEEKELLDQVHALRNSEFKDAFDAEFNRMAAKHKTLAKNE